MNVLDQEADQGFIRSKGFKGEAMRELATEVCLSLFKNYDKYIQWQMYKRLKNTGLY